MRFIVRSGLSIADYAFLRARAIWANAILKSLKARPEPLLLLITHGHTIVEMSQNRHWKEDEKYVGYVSRCLARKPVYADFVVASKAMARLQYSPFKTIRPSFTRYRSDMLPKSWAGLQRCPSRSRAICNHRSVICLYFRFPSPCRISIIRQQCSQC